MELLRKRKGSQHVQNSFSLILLAAEWPFKYSRPLTLIFFYHQYQCTSPFRDCLILLLVAILFSSCIYLPVIFFFSSLILFNITLPILVSIVSSPNRYHFAYPCNNYLLLYLIVFYLSWFLCFSLSQSPAQLSLSLHLLVIFFSFSICLVDTTSYILVTIISSPCRYHFT